MPEIGQIISHYRNIEKLGGGGMGVVYKAEDTRLKRTAELNFPSAELSKDAHALGCAELFGDFEMYVMGIALSFREGKFMRAFAKIAAQFLRSFCVNCEEVTDRGSIL